MYKIAVLGERESVMGFAALGLAVFPVESAEEAADRDLRRRAGAADRKVRDERHAGRHPHSRR